MAVADFVLKRFSKLEQPDVPFLVQDAADAVELLVKHGLETAQNQVHAG
jgi:PTH1 family peptidyl-tRNA hydrolase